MLVVPHAMLPATMQLSQKSQHANTQNSQGIHSSAAQQLLRAAEDPRKPIVSLGGGQKARLGWAGRPAGHLAELSPLGLQLRTQEHRQGRPRPAH